MSKFRIALGALSLSAAGLLAVATHEGYTDKAVQPLPGDKWTQGFGSTTKSDGSPVKQGDRTDPVAALGQAVRDVRKFEGAIKGCITVPLTQGEFDASVSLAYNIGPSAFCSSTVVRRFNAGDYAGACDAFLMWDKFKGQPIRGLQLRRQQERETCLR